MTGALTKLPLSALVPRSSGSWLPSNVRRPTDVTPSRGAYKGHRILESCRPLRVSCPTTCGLFDIQLPLPRRFWVGGAGASYPPALGMITECTIEMLYMRSTVLLCTYILCTYCKHASRGRCAACLTPAARFDEGTVLPVDMANYKPRGLLVYKK